MAHLLLHNSVFPRLPCCLLVPGPGSASFFIGKFALHLLCSFNPHPPPNPHPKLHPNPTRTSTLPAASSGHACSSWWCTPLARLSWSPGEKTGSSPRCSHNPLCLPHPRKCLASWLVVDLKELFPDAAQQPVRSGPCVCVCTWPLSLNAQKEVGVETTVLTTVGWWGRWWWLLRLRVRICHGKDFSFKNHPNSLKTT